MFGYYFLSRRPRQSEITCLAVKSATSSPNSGKRLHLAIGLDGVRLEPLEVVHDRNDHQVSAEVGKHLPFKCSSRRRQSHESAF